ncbi:hypothetical protein CgunFtcFv8_007590 [Champsocephalus gunnari]|uniref:Uncharacterized protein n=1 Tax=Champsocephalus gunnari TaxID=52237 RepID=A0AAN8H5W2_CHAGU|nr:hypothetical protein CgunFtcFv8_007590 [Champsocephalus gunnari]
MCPCISPHHHQQPNPTTPISCSHYSRVAFPSVLWFLIPKGVSGSVDTTGIQHHPSSRPLLPTAPSPTSAYAEEGSISTVAAAKHHITKEMRTSDSNHQEGR